MNTVNALNAYCDSLLECEPTLDNALAAEVFIQRLTVHVWTGEVSLDHANALADTLKAHYTEYFKELHKSA
jgi:uncharacterized protein YaaN involved in tellurite resistance